MNYRKLYVLLLLSVLISLPFFFSGCDDSENEKISCRILSVSKEGILEEYTYNADNKVQTIVCRYPNDFVTTGTLEYNEKGQLTKYTVTDNNSPVGTAVTELIYEGQDKPKKMRSWRSMDPLSPSEQTHNFHHDERGRLVTTETIYENADVTIRRFEYDRNDNVSKVYFKNNEYPENLDTENLNFDDKPSLYSQTPELEILNVYGEFGLPNKNNVLTTKIYQEPKEPLIVIFEPIYDGNGLIVSNHPSDEYGIEFSGVTRYCQ